MDFALKYTRIDVRVLNQLINAAVTENKSVGWKSFWMHWIPCLHTFNFTNVLFVQSDALYDPKYKGNGIFFNYTHMDIPAYNRY